MLLIIPLPLFFASTIFGVRGLEAWVVIGMIWTFMSAFTVILYPLWESRKELAVIIRGMVKVCTTSCPWVSHLIPNPRRTYSLAEAENTAKRSPSHQRLKTLHDTKIITTIYVL